jgi:hypothetical protein
VSIVVACLASAAAGIAIGWVACAWHWHTRLSEAWSQLRAAAWRRQLRQVPVKPERAVDITDVTDAFGLGLVVERVSHAEDDEAGGQQGSSLPREGGTQ